MSFVALLAVRNEERYLKTCLESLIRQGLKICVIDNDSTDGTRKIINSFYGGGVFRVENYPYEGFFDHAGILSFKERLSREIEADWFLHVDADEILEPPIEFKTLSHAFSELDRAGFNAINFDQFVFFPINVDVPENGSFDYVKINRYYYYFSPKPLNHIRAWKKNESKVDLVSSGGHQTYFDGIKIYEKNFILRHYIALSLNHLKRKYSQDRIYSLDEVMQRGWHGPRANFNPAALVPLNKSELIEYREDGFWNTQDPKVTHPFFGG